MNRENLAKTAYAIHRIYRKDESLPTWEQASQRDKDSVLRKVDNPGADHSDPITAVIQALKDAKAGNDRPYDVAVQYIGRRETFNDTLYGTGLTFSRDQVRKLPPEIAPKFLRHQDLFKRVEAAKPAATEQPAANEASEPDDDDTTEVLERSRAAKKDDQNKENQLLDVIDQVNQMTKAGLAEFAQRNFQHEFKANTKVGEMRAEVVQMIHQYGLP